MAENKNVIDYLKDKDIAIEFYRALCNMRWYKVTSIDEDELIVNRLKGQYPNLWSCSWRTAGGIIADIRNANYNTKEDYMDFYCSGNEGEISDTVKQCFNRMGWES